MRATGLRGKVVIVTGGAAGIGRATARRFAEEGCRVAVWDVSDAPVLDELRSAGGEAVFQKVDVSRREAVDAAVAEVVGRWGQVDVLVNNAGIVRDAQLVKWKDGQIASMLSDETFDAVINVNQRGVFLCTRAVVPHMIKAGGGCILSASSVVGLYGNFGQTNYTAAKAAVIAMTRSWARELGRYKIRVNAVAPGFVEDGDPALHAGEGAELDGRAHPHRPHGGAHRHRGGVRVARLRPGLLRARDRALRGRRARGGDVGDGPPRAHRRHRPLPAGARDHERLSAGAAPPVSRLRREDGGVERDPEALVGARGLDDLRRRAARGAAGPRAGGKAAGGGRPRHPRHGLAGLHHPRHLRGPAAQARGAARRHLRRRLRLRLLPHRPRRGERG